MYFLNLFAHVKVAENLWTWLLVPTFPPQLVIVQVQVVCGSILHTKTGKYSVLKIIFQKKFTTDASKSCDRCTGT